MPEEAKRKMSGTGNDGDAKRKKQMPQWKKNKAASDGTMPRSNRSHIESGDAGIFVTFDKFKDSACLSEMKDILSQYAGEIAPQSSTGEDEVSEVDGGAGDIEAEIQKEIADMKPGAAGSKPLFWSVKLEIPCVAFIKVAEGLDPVELVHKICEDAQADPGTKRGRWIKRMTPMTLMRKTLGSGLDDVCEKVLKPHFHSGGPSFKYAIRPSIRNNNTWHRDEVIKLVADAVGTGHTVDLKNYDKLILVDVYRNVCGMSVVGSDYEKLKRFNLAEIYEPTPKVEEQTTGTAGETAVGASN